MGGSRNSSIDISNGKQILRCGCNLFIKRFEFQILRKIPRGSSRDVGIDKRYEFLEKLCYIVLKMSNFFPILFLICYYMQVDIICDLFIYDQLDEMDWKSRNKAVDKILEVDCNNYEDVISYMREFDKDFGNEFVKEFSKEYGKDSCSKKPEKTKDATK